VDPIKTCTEVVVAKAVAAATEATEAADRAATETVMIEVQVAAAATVTEVVTEAVATAVVEVAVLAVVAVLVVLAVLAVLHSPAASPRLHQFRKARPHLSCLTISDSPLKSLTHSQIFTSTGLSLALLTVTVRLVWRPSVTLTRLCH
jgi:hypothetical protein